MKINQLYKKIMSMITFVAILGITHSAYAAMKINIVRGSHNLINDIASWLLIFIPISGAVGIGISSIIANLSDNDPNVKAQAGRRKKWILWYTVIGMGASGLIAGITSYYK